eukprot:scaffold8923_cov67-Phaeocystis_antarctica.AAC.2
MMPDCFTPRRKFPKALRRPSIPTPVATCPVDRHDERWNEEPPPLLDEVLLHLVAVADHVLGLVAAWRGPGVVVMVVVVVGTVVDERGE